MIGKITMKKNQCGNIMTKKKCLCKYLQMKLKILSKIPKLEKKKKKKGKTNKKSVPSKTE